MGTTAVDAIPGGLLDFLLASWPPPAGGEALSTGRAQQAIRELEQFPSSPLQRTWLYVAQHTALLSLPDGAALSYVDPLDPRPPAPTVPAPPDANDETFALWWLAVNVCIRLRDICGCLAPHVPPEVSPSDVSYVAGLKIVDAARDLVADRADQLVPQLDLMVANLAARSGRQAEAWRRLDQAREGFKRATDLRGEAAANLVAGDWHAAPFSSPVTWGLALGQPVGVDSGLARSLEDDEHGAVCNEASANSAYNDAEDLYARVADARGEAHVQWRRAYVAMRMGRSEDAVTRAQEATQALTAVGDDASALIADAHARVAALADGQLPDPAEAVDPILEWANGPGSLSLAIGVGRMYARIGRAWGNRGPRRCELSLSASAVAEEIWAGLQRPTAQTQVLVDQARALVTLGARRQATVVLEAAFEGASALHRQGTSFGTQWLREALLVHELYNVAHAARDVEAMDRIVRRMGPVSAAVRSFLISDSPKDPSEEMYARQVLGIETEFLESVPGLLYRAQDARVGGESGAADRLFDQAEEIASRGDPDEANRQLAFVRAFQGRNQEAANLHRAWLAKALVHIEDQRRASSAATVSALALQQERQVRYQALLFSVQVSDVENARQQLASLQHLADPWWEDLAQPWEADDTVGRLREAEDDLEEAAQVFTRAATAAETARSDLRRDDLKVAFGGNPTVQAIYRNAARVALRRREKVQADNSPTAAEQFGRDVLRLLEAGKSRALTDLLVQGGQHAHHRHRLPPELLDSWRGAQAKAALQRDRLAAALNADARNSALVEELREELLRAESEVEEASSALRASDPRFWRLTGHSDAWNPDDLLSSLDPGEVVLIYSIDRPDFVACGVTNAGVVAATWSNEERRIDGLVRRLLAACADGGSWEESADALAQILLDPIASALDGATRVYVVASGPTLGIPFGVLPWRGQPFGEQVSLSVLPSLSVFSLLGVKKQPTSALCVGDPIRMQRRIPHDSPLVTLPALPGAVAEARAVAKRYGTEALVRATASKRAVRERITDADVVHLATHGIVDAESPLASAVLLADGEELNVAELLSLRLDTQLVVLSACQTGTGHSLGGDELLGLGRALLAAGARSAIVTLWPVDDVTTAVFMAHFHTLFTGNQPVTAALKETIKYMRSLDTTSLRRAYAQIDGVPRGSEILRTISAEPPQPLHRPEPIVPNHPNRWAPFVLIGR